MKKIGYVRVSNGEQSLELQRKALTAAGCSLIFYEEGRAGTSRGPALAKAIASLTAGDALVVWRLDRLGQSLVHLVELLQDLAGRGAEFRSLTEKIDSTATEGHEVFKVMIALAESERFLISEQTRAGMDAARSRGHHVGRPSALCDEDICAAVSAVVEKGDSIADVAKRFHVHPRTIRRAVDHFMTQMPSARQMSEVDPDFETGS